MLGQYLHHAIKTITAACWAFYDSLRSYANVRYWTVAVTQDEHLVHKFPAPEKALSLEI